MHHRWPLDYLNIKCVIFSIYVSLAYWFVPKSNYNVIFIVNWAMTQWYNASYECKHQTWYVDLAMALLGTSILHAAPAKNKTVLVLALYLPYLLMAWWDYLLNCSFRMNPTVFPFGRWVYLPFKPPPYKRKYETLDPKVMKNIKAFDKYVLIFLLTVSTLWIVKKMTKT